MTRKKNRLSEVGEMTVTHAELELVWDTRSPVTECPVWDQRKDRLLFADLEVVSNRVPKVEAGLKKAKPAKEREADEAELALLRRVVAADRKSTRLNSSH